MDFEGKIVSSGFRRVEEITSTDSLLVVCRKRKGKLPL